MAVRTNEPVAALTFDDGPHPEFTPRLLDLLQRYRVRATFFLVGEAAEARPDLVRRIANEGHAVGNHSWDHPPFVRLRGRARREQLRRCQAALGSPAPRWFRPPYGEHTAAVRLDALWYGLDVIGWTLDVDDWFDTDAARMAHRLTTGIHPGCIVLLHDAIHDGGRPQLGRPLTHAACLDRSPSLAALESALDQLAERWRFLTVPELLRLGPVIRKG